MALSDSRVALKDLSGPVIRYECMLSILKTDYFQMRFLYKSDMRISTVGKHYMNYKIKHLYAKKTIPFTF